MLTRRQTGSGSFMKGGLRTVVPFDAEAPREADRGSLEVLPQGLVQHVDLLVQVLVMGS